MARIRTIKPEFPHSESMGKVSRDARLAFILMWTIADDEGRLRGNSRMLASLLFPYDDDAPNNIDGWVSELEAQKCIQRYEMEESIYIEILNWKVNQKIDKPSQSKIPQFVEDSRGFVEDSSTPRVRKGRERKGEEGSKSASAPTHIKVSLEELSVESISEWLSDKRKHGFYCYHDPAAVLEIFKDYCRSNGKKYSDYVAAYRNAFAWDRCKPAGVLTSAQHRQQRPQGRGAIVV